MEKIFTFIVNEENKILILLGSKENPQYHKSFWYTVTGGCEIYDKSKEDTVRREVKEETNLEVKEIMYLNWIFKYNSLGLECIEYAYISFVNSRKNYFKRREYRL